MTRYFLISYALTGTFFRKSVYGSFTLSYKSFPSKKDIEGYIGWDGTKTILNIFEFKSYEDYKDYLNLQ